MHPLTRSAVAAALLGLAAIAAPLSAAEQLPPAVGAVIDYQRVLREAKAAKSIRDQIETRRKLYQDQIAKEEQKLNDADKELAKQRAVLSAEAFNGKRQEFQKKVGTVQRMVQERRRTLDQVSSTALNQVRNAMIQIVSDLSEERGFNLVLPSSAVLLFSPGIDLTEEVIKRLDGKLPNVKVPEKVAAKSQ
jgi:outer membrane protein